MSDTVGCLVLELAAQARLAAWGRMIEDDPTLLDAPDAAWARAFDAGYAAGLVDGLAVAHGTVPRYAPVDAQGASDAT